MKHYFILDAAPLFYATHHAQGFLSHNGELTGMRFGFMRSVRSYLKKLNPDTVIIAFDSPGGVLKAKNVPEYKANREMTDDKRAMYAQIPSLKDMVSKTYWHQVSAGGYEADDLIATYARAYRDRGNRVTIVSTDNDLCQLVGSRIHIWVPGKKGAKPYVKDEQYVLDHFGVYPEHLLIYRACAGDVSDNLEGTMSSEPLEILAALLKSMKFRSNKEIIEALKSSDQLSGFFVGDLWEKFKKNVGVMKLVNVPKEDRLLIKGQNNKADLEGMFSSLGMNSLVRDVETFLRR